MDHPYHYVGCFIDLSDFRKAIRGIRTDPLKNDIQFPHVTFAYRPEKVDQSLFGSVIQVKIIGYGNNGENEGLKVQLYSCDPVLQSMIERLQCPHITIAVSDYGEAVNTRKLQFKEITPVELTGKYGGYLKEGKVDVQRRSEESIG